jgi:hypothetical protein
MAPSPDEWYIPGGGSARQRGEPVTVDEELNLLDDALRRLKVEYDIFFGGGSKKPPNDTEWRVQSLVKKYSDSQKLSFAQRFKYNTIVQRYAIYSDLWRQKMKIKEEGYRRPQDAVLGIQGLRTVEEHGVAEALHPAAPVEAPPESFRVVCSGGQAEQAAVRSLYDAMMVAKKQAGEAVPDGASFEFFRTFVSRKTEQLQKDFGCKSVEYTVETQDGQVKLKAKPKVG